MLAEDYFERLAPALPLLDPELRSGCVAVFKKGRLRVRPEKAFSPPQTFNCGWDTVPAAGKWDNRDGASPFGHRVAGAVGKQNPPMR